MIIDVAHINMNLILFKRSEISDGDGKSIQLESKDPRTKHIFDHLKKCDGDTVTVGIISGRQGNAIVRYDVDNCCQKRLDFDFDTSVVIDHSSSKDSNHKIVLVLSMPFPKRLKYLWPQISSMGVTRVCIVRGSLSDSSFAKSSSITPKVYRPLIEEGMSQGCHTKEVTVDIEVEDVLSRAVLDKLGLTMRGSTSSQLSCTTRDIRIVLDCGDEASSLPLPLHRVVMKNISDVADTTTLESSNCVVLAIGSERGWTEDEARLFQEAGFHAASLGKSILRVDTAVVAGLGIVSAILDEQEVAKNTNHQQKIQSSTIDSSQKRKHDA
jgi:16S rRNA (uracil1498-N3)-methyltransferase